MSTCTISRRAFLGTGIGVAGVAATLSAADGTVQAASLLDPVRELGAGDNLAVWVRVHPEQRVELQAMRLSDRGDPAVIGPQLTLQMRELSAAQPLSAWGQSQQAAGCAQLLVRTIAATSWGVRPEQVEIEGRRIVHPPTGRSVHHAVWVEFV